MNTYKYDELTSCVDQELIEIKFNGVDKMNVAFLTEEQYTNYKNEFNSVKRTEITSPAYFRTKEIDKLYLVLDCDGKDVSKIAASYKRFSPDFTRATAQGLPPIGTTYVINAHDTDAKKSMIQYWKDNQSENSKLNLSNKTFKCPSCGKTVSTNNLNGAHVNRINDMSGKLFITPTCEACNKSKVDRIFKVDRVDIIPAPEE